jgi:glycosyltransferase involved in cell wall biosynthesis
MHDAYFEIVNHPVNLGQGAALQTGAKKALELGGTVFCSVDGDGQHQPDSCMRMLETFKNGECDILLGSRFLNNGANMPILKRIVLKGGILVNYLYAGLWLHDAHCGLRVFNREFASKLEFYNKRQAHASEVLWIIKHFGFRYKEFPADVIYTDYAIKKGQSIWNSFVILKDLLLHKIYLLRHPVK